MGETSVKPAESAACGDESAAPAPFALPAEHGVVWTLWLTYGVFYFCRNNLSVAATAMMGPLESGGLGLSKEEVGWILAAAKVVYGLGQLLNGQLSERFSPRVMLAIGMFGSAALNVLFGVSTGFFFLLFVWACNGFLQSLGWSPCMRVVANWVPVQRRGKAIGIIGTGYQLTTGLTFVVAGQAAYYLGWRGALWVPAIILSLAGLFMLVCLRESPAEPVSSAGKKIKAGSSISVAESLYLTLYNPALWLLGLALGLLNACRYGFLDWGVAHLMETTKLQVDKATLQYCVIAVGAVAGSYLAGWATDRFFGSRRAPVICFLMVLLGIISLGYDWVVRESAIGTMGLLVVVGFCIFGPQVMLVGTAPADLAHRNTSAAAAGFVNFLGYMGAATGDVVTGYFSNPSHGGWQVAIYIWAGWAFAGAIVTAVLWNTTSRRLRLIPGVVPKLLAVAMLATAAAALTRSYSPLVWQVAAYSAAVVLLGTFLTRWAALPAMLVAAAGLVYVFSTYVQEPKVVTWEQCTALASFGLALVAGLMILVERKDEPCA